MTVLNKEKINNPTNYPYLLEDMVVVLMRCMSSPPKLKSDHVSFLKKVEQELSSNLVSIPEHIGSKCEMTAGDRITEAVRFLINLKLAVKSGMSSKSMSLVISELGHKWLNSSTAKKLELIHVGLRGAKEKASFAFINAFKFALSPIPLIIENSDFIPDQFLVDAFSAIEAEDGYDFDDFINFHAKQNNPLLKIAEEKSRRCITIGFDHRIRSDQELEFIWAEYLKSFMITRLFALGALSFGSTDNGQLAFSLNQPALFLFEQTDEFKYSDANNDKVVIVQPDFEVIFLAPSPAIESKFNPFAQRIGSGLGVLFKITKQSILHAASIEMTAEDVLEVINSSSLQPAPDNVRTEITNWFGQCRYFEARETYLVKCPDLSTARRILEVAGREVTPISDTVFELKDIRRKITFLKLLKENGIFLH